MCAINPKHQHEFTLRVYTSEAITEQAFHDLIMAKVLEAEQSLNADAKLRWHIS